MSNVYFKVDTTSPVKNISSQIRLIISGVNDSNKFAIRNDVTGANIFAVSTANDTVLVGNSGRLVIRDGNNGQKLRVINTGEQSVFNVNTINDSVTTRYNTLDNGSGNSTIKGNLRLDSTGDTQKFRVANAAGAPVFNVDTTNEIVAIAGANNADKFRVNNNTGTFVFKVDTTGEFVTIAGANNANKFRVNHGGGVAVFTVDSVAGSTKGKFNTLDDGSGNSTFTGNMAVNGASTFTGNMAITGANNANKFRINSNTGEAIFTVDTSTRSMRSRLNTLDDGGGGSTFNGNMVVHGEPTFNGYMFCNAGSFFGGNTIFNANSYIGGTATVNGVMTVNGNFLHTKHIMPLGDETYNIGEPGNRWLSIRVQNVIPTPSDFNLKNTIEISDLGLKFIEALRPVSYKFNNGTSGRTHYGLISQEVEATLTDFNKTTVDFAGVVKEAVEETELIYDEENNPVIDEQTGRHKKRPTGVFTDQYLLCYTEFIAPMIKAIQELSAKNEELENQIKTLTKVLNKIPFLKDHL